LSEIVGQSWVESDPLFCVLQEPSFFDAKFVIPGTGAAFDGRNTHFVHFREHRWTIEQGAQWHRGSRSG
jgi:hypothetical protein